MMKSIGKLTYSPKSHLGSNEKWLVLMCDDSISQYYRSLFYREYPWKGKLTRPVWGTHISIIRGERIPNFQLWGLDTNKIIEFEYEGGVLDNNEYYWLKTKCPYLSDLRIKYGLTPEPRFGFHLTIGRTTENGK
jgi:hypothetical protein